MRRGNRWDCEAWVGSIRARDKCPPFTHPGRIPIPAVFVPGRILIQMGAGGGR